MLFEKQRQNKNMKYFTIVLLAATLIASGLVTTLVGQQPPAAGGDKKADAGTDNKAVRLAIENYSPLAVVNDKFIISGINFDRRYAPTGLGEFLDVVFNIRNLTSGPVKLYGYIMAFHESDAVDKLHRRVVPYPSWRHYDPAKEMHLIHTMTVTPKDIPDNQIWNEKDRDFLMYKRIVDRMRDTVAVRIPIKMVHPSIWKYMAYISLNHTKGLPFTLHGEEQPKETEKILTNFIVPSQAEKAAKVYTSINKHKYTVEAQRRQSVFRSHHYAKFQANYKFFNRVSIVIFDATKADEYEKGIQPILERLRSIQNQRFELRKRKKDIEDRIKKERETAEANEKSYTVKQEDTIALANINKEMDEAAITAEKIRVDLLKLQDPLLYKKTYILKKWKRRD